VSTQEHCNDELETDVVHAGEIYLGNFVATNDGRVITRWNLDVIQITP